MAREGNTLTRTMRFEPRQHELLGLDLGEGIPRRALIFGGLCFVAWWALLWLLIGAPQAATSMLWFLPPALMATYGWRDGTVTPRRRRITEWALALRWIGRGHRSVINMGRRPTTKQEQAGLVERLAHRWGHDDPLAVVMPWRAAENRHDRPAMPARAGSPIEGASRVQLVGTDAARDRMTTLIERDRRKGTRRGSRRMTKETS